MNYSKQAALGFRLSDSANYDLDLYINFHVATHQYFDSLMTLLSSSYEILEMY